MLPSVMTGSHAFASVKAPSVQRSTFNRSHGHKTTFKAGNLVPIYVDEALPGDSINLKMDYLARMGTPIFPIMDNLWLDTFFFAVPNRLLWINWERFNGAQDNPGDSIAFTLPVLDNTTGPDPEGGLFDYLGIPPAVALHADTKVSALPSRAYQLIWNEWFRDENLQNSIIVDTGNGPDDMTDYSLQKRGKRHDYFTSALPFPQKGTAVQIPLGNSAPVQGTGISIGVIDNLNESNRYGLGREGSEQISAFQAAYNVAVNSNYSSTGEINTQEAIGLTVTGASGMAADLSQATAATINQLRESFMIQTVQEKDARGGTRYTEIIRSHFGVTSPDGRLQRPEYLGGSSKRITVNPVAQTSKTDGADTLGVLAAHVNLAGSGNGFNKSFTEHMTILGFVNVRADITYQQGIDRMWSRQTRYDFYLPALAHLGEQAVLNQEIFISNSTVDQDVFGYQERWSEYRYKPSRISSEFRSDAALSLDAWHLSEDFGSVPGLNASFITDKTEITLDRSLAVQGVDSQIIFDSYFNIKHARPMPVYSTPQPLGRF